MKRILFALRDLLGFALMVALFAGFARLVLSHRILLVLLVVALCVALVKEFRSRSDETSD